MPLLPSYIRERLFDTLSRKTMRYVESIPEAQSDAFTRRVYAQIRRDFFVNGSLTSRSSVPPVFASTWALGREAILVEDQLDKMTKEAMAASLSSVNDCPYCGDMLISLVDAADERDAATAIFNDLPDDIDTPLMRRIRWVRNIASAADEARSEQEIPFTQAELPEAFATLLAMSDINRFSHVVMAGSPVAAPFGSRRVKLMALRRFAAELVPTQRHRVVPGEALPLLPQASLPHDLDWAAPNPRLARTVAGVAATVEREANRVLNAPTRETVTGRLGEWRGEAMPLSRAWVEDEVAGLDGSDADIARLALLLAKASYQLDDALVQRVRNRFTQEDFVRVLSWCSFTAARQQVANIVTRYRQSLPSAA